MRTTLRLAALAAIALAGTACEPTVIIERDETVSIASGARWSWSLPDGDGPSAAQGEVTPPPELHDRLSDAITQGLEARGFRLTTPDSAEFFVHFHLASREVVDTIPPLGAPRAVGDRDPQDWGRYGDPEQLRNRTMSWQEGLLVVDALSADGRHVAWRGIVYGEVKPEATQDPTSAIRGAVERLLAQFP
ncbi:MAG TPA: DUF4136 domain-containing protein [Gemmatimonadaceae bacterium]|nr:DUF4136 domain-containing protein [Gemmatimonadaceae bacterium]HRQ77278.1 DUF4136 domain-containing protein [Gemmatimonadaceae bacterium]